jgi:5-methylcytosine-specific restriction endonuclease McrA
MKADARLVYCVAGMPRLPFYNKTEWQTARRQALHDSGYRCQRCDVSLVGKGRAAHVHHRKPYRKAPALGTEPLNLQALCIACHNKTHAEAKNNRSACDVRGYPLDISHPWFEK